MNKYHVTYYYLATGMEGNADSRDYGYVDANSNQEAIEIVGRRLHPELDKSLQTWGLSAKKVHEYIFVPPGSGMSYIKEQINELNQLSDGEMLELEEYHKKDIEVTTKLMNMNNTLRTQIDALNAVRSKNFIVASVASNGDFSLSASPAAHISATDARIEAKRLAHLSPGKAFVILNLTGAEMVPVSTVSI